MHSTINCYLNSFYNSFTSSRFTVAMRMSNDGSKIHKFRKLVINFKSNGRHMVPYESYELYDMTHMGHMLIQNFYDTLEPPVSG